jgi:hypothetical protein
MFISDALNCRSSYFVCFICCHGYLLLTRRFLFQCFYLRKILNNTCRVHFNDKMYVFVHLCNAKHKFIIK